MTPEHGDDRINLVPPGESFTAPALALYEEVMSEQAKTLADGAKARVGIYQTL